MFTTFNIYARGESRIIVPVNGNEERHDTCAKVEALLLNSDTGGFTTTYGLGGWREDDHKTPIAIYDVAGLSFDTLNECAKVVLASGETDVYVRLPDGQSGWFNQLDAGEEIPQIEAWSVDQAPEDTLAGAQGSNLHGTRDTGWRDKCDQWDFSHKPHDHIVSRATGANAEFANIEARGMSPKNRALRLLVWAAKCHVHSRRQRVAGDLGALPHSEQDVQEAIDAIEAVIGTPEPATDEGVRTYNRV